MRELNIFIPYNINYIVITKDNKLYIYFYNNIYFFSLYLKNNNLNINKSTNVIKVNDINKNKLNNLSVTELKRFLFSWESMFFNKIKFSGKGFKFKKKECNLFLFFNRAHKCFFIGTNIILIRLSKNKVIVLKNNLNNIRHDSKLITSIRSNNIFTKRGLRLSRQIIYKKKGKTAAH